MLKTKSYEYDLFLYFRQRVTIISDQVLINGIKGLSVVVEYVGLSGFDL